MSLAYEPRLSGIFPVLQRSLNVCSWIVIALGLSVIDSNKGIINKHWVYSFKEIINQFFNQFYRAMFRLAQCP